MGFDANYDSRVYDRLVEVAEAHESYYTYQADARYDRIVTEYVSHYSDTDRPTSYERLKRLGAYAFDDVHPRTIWKAFMVRAGRGWRYTGTAYTLEGEMRGEEVETMAHLAHDLGVTPDEVWYDFADADHLDLMRVESA